VLGTGRSGSTSILTMLNAIPGVYVAGENYDAVGKFRELNSSLPKAYGLRRPGINAWYHHHIDTELLRCDMQGYVKHLIGRIDANAEIIGFKEIRDNTKEQMDFFTELFPCGKFIINWRKNVTQQQQSQFHRASSTTLLSDINAIKERWVADHPTQTFALPLEDVSIAMFNRLLSWLDIHHCRFVNVAHANAHGYSLDRHSRTLVKGQCAFGSS